MRFSSLFQQPSPPVEALGEDPPREPMPPHAAAAQDLPEDLDARVRLVGEWQLGET